MVLEVLSFGTISKLFENLRQKQDGQKVIIRRFGFGSGTYFSLRFDVRYDTWHKEWPGSRKVYTIVAVILDPTPVGTTGSGER